MKNNFQNIALIFSIILFVLLACALFLLYRQIRANDGKAEQASVEAGSEASRRAEIQSLDRSLAAIGKEREMLDTHFAKSSDVVPFLDSVEALASKAGASAQIVSVDLSPEHNTLLVSVHASGSFESLYKFLALLENSPHELEFASVNIERQDAGAALENKTVGVSEWQADFKIKLISFVP